MAGKRYSDVVQRISLAEQENALAADLQYISLEAEARTIWDGGSIAGAGPGGRRYSPVQNDWHKYGRKVLRIDNNQNAPMTIGFNRMDAGDFLNPDGSPISITVAANAMNVLVGPEQLPFLGWSIEENIVLVASSTTGATTGWFVIAGHFSPLFG